MTRTEENTINRRDLRSGKAAKILGISMPTILDLARAGEIPYAETKGGHFRFSRQEVIAYGLKKGFLTDKNN